MNLATNLSGSSSSAGSGALVITGQINGGAPPAVVEGAYYIVTTAGGAYALKSIYLGAGGVWSLVYTAATMPIDQSIVPSVALAAGTDTYAAETLYFWDSGTSAFVVDGSAAAAAAAAAAAHAANTGAHAIKDTSLNIEAAGDATKKAHFLATGVTGGQNRALTIPDKDIMLAGTVDVSDHSGLTTGIHGAAAGEVLPAMVSSLAVTVAASGGKLVAATAAQLQTFTPTAIKTGNYTCSASYEDVRVNPTAAGFWVKPIAVPADGDRWVITNEYASVNAIVLTANTATVAQTIEGAASITMARAYFVITLKYNLALLNWTVESVN
jgi:hypothetical protein